MNKNEIGNEPPITRVTVANPVELGFLFTVGVITAAVAMSAILSGLFIIFLVLANLGNL